MHVLVKNLKLNSTQVASCFSSDVHLRSIPEVVGWEFPVKSSPGPGQRVPGTQTRHWAAAPILTSAETRISWNCKQSTFFPSLVIKVNEYDITADTWRKNNAFMTSKRHCEVVSTPWLRCFYVSCPLGRPSYLSKWDTYTGKTVSLYWNGTLIPYPFPNFPVYVEVWELISNFIPHSIMDVIT